MVAECFSVNIKLIFIQINLRLCSRGILVFHSEDSRCWQVFFFFREPLDALLNIIEGECSSPKVILFTININVLSLKFYWLMIGNPLLFSAKENQILIHFKPLDIFMRLLRRLRSLVGSGASANDFGSSCLRVDSR